MKGITATYRMTNKPLPIRHSPYVAGVLRPLKVCNINYVLWFILLSRQWDGEDQDKKAISLR